MIECTLRHASLAAPPYYEALSYTWGNPKTEFNKIPLRDDPDSLSSIKLGGRHAKAKYNLETALQQLRHEAKPFTLWIDVNLH
jgi:hypothetical protein